MPFTYEYPKADHAVDAVVFGVDLEALALKVLLIERGIEPYKGAYALPGGFLRLDETLDAAVRRELVEETALDLGYLEQLYTFDAVDRDPRGRVISTAYLGLVEPDKVAIAGGTDAAHAQWFDALEPPPLAFDHAEILDTALERLRSKVRWQPVGIELLPASFTLTDLQLVYEIILGRELDKRNFRRKVLSFDVLVATGKKRSEGHRPAELYRFDKRKYQRLAKEGIAFEV